MNIRAKIFGGHVPVEEPLIKPKKPKGAKAEALGSITVARETRRLSNSRGEDRHHLTGEHARLTHGERDIEVELLNLSGGGAMVTGPFQPMLWDRVHLHLGDHGTIECVVRWLRDARIGLEFAHETQLDCTSDEGASILRDVIEQSFPDISITSPCPAPAPTDKLDALDEHRVALRHPLIWNGVLHHDFQSDAVRIRNISASGAMVETTSKVRVGCEPLLDLGSDVSMSATVEWSVGDQLGLRFHAPFDLSYLSKSRPKVAASAWKAPSFMKTDEDDRWGRLSVSELRQELEGFLKR